MNGAIRASFGSNELFMNRGLSLRAHPSRLNKRVGKVDMMLVWCTGGRRVRVCVCVCGLEGNPR